MKKRTRKKRREMRKKKKKREIKIRVKVSPRLQWAIPYLKKAKARMPSLILPTQIRSFMPVRRKIMRVLGNVYFETRIIVLATHTQQTTTTKRGRIRVKKIVAIPRAEILDTLAHELAHMRYPEHNYEHDEYTRTIFKTFDMTQKCPTCKGTGRVQMESKP
ncbi:MAG: hypothetical protein HYU99_11540 [Deltaproteobacteria bacterium]|nr:hypothetical protein [Deltaproteobacteria bacterium]